MRYAAEHITSKDDDVTLMVGVDTQVVHGFVNCNATGAITGIGNALPREVLQLVALSKQAAKGDPKARRLARELEAALVGQPLRSADPRHALRLFASHKLAGPWPGWTVGAGLRLQSNTYASVDNLTTRQGGYALFDALLAYRINSTLSLQLNANNLFDKVYYAKFSPNSRYFNNYYGDPRNLTLTLRASF